MRKKIPLIGGIINLIESLKGDIGIIENTDVATHSISAGSYVIWHNELYKASSAISVDDALSSSNLTAVSGGVGNELKNKILQVNCTVSSGANPYAKVSAYVPNDGVIIGVWGTDGHAAIPFQNASNEWFIIDDAGATGWTRTFKILYAMLA